MRGGGREEREGLGLKGEAGQSLESGEETVRTDLSDARDHAERTKSTKVDVIVVRLVRTFTGVRLSLSFTSLSSPKMSIPTHTRTWVINQKPTDAITDSTFKLVEGKALPDRKDGEVLVKIKWVSNDPAQRTWIDKTAVKDRGKWSKRRCFLFSFPAFADPLSPAPSRALLHSAYGPFPEEGDSMPSIFLGEIVESKSEKFKQLRFPSFRFPCPSIEPPPLPSTHRPLIPPSTLFQHTSIPFLLHPLDPLFFTVSFAFLLKFTDHLLFYCRGDLVTGFGSWSEYLVLPEGGVMPARKVEGHSESAALSVLGLTTATAYAGLHNVGHIKPEHTLVVSGAAGATGSAVVQIAKKIVGVKKVIGIAGGQKKVRILSLGG
jgi:hypothetical protein